jgi:hypothetical protein
MCRIQMIRNEPGLVSIPLERAVYCENCDRVSNSALAAVRSLWIGGDRPIGPDSHRPRRSGSSASGSILLHPVSSLNVSALGFSHFCLTIR